MLILFLFFCSGATALVYEVLWSKYLALLFGSTVQAQTVVLAVFMGGLALGNQLFSRRADRAPRPLAIYGAIEIAIGGYAVLFSLLNGAADSLFVSIGSGLLEHRGWLLLLKGALSIGLLGFPTVLMGGTLPILAAWLQRQSADAGRRTARFYAINSLGAVCGAGLAGFVLVPRLGMPSTINATATVNILIGAAAVLLAQRSGGKVSSEKTGSRDSAKPAKAEKEAGIVRLACLVVALSGAVSMGLEVLASRCLALIFGSSLQAFAIVLMAFILGIGVGSVLIASAQFRRGQMKGATVLLLLVAAALIGVVVGNLQNLVEVYRHVRSGLSTTLMGYYLHQIFVSLMSLCVLGLPAGALGAVLPLWIRIVSEDSDLLGRRVGRLLTWNTVGAVIGVLITGFLLMPELGLRGSFAVLALILGVAGIITAFATRQRVGGVAGAVVVVALVLVTATGGEGWRYALSAGVFRVHETGPLIPISERSKVTQLLFYEDAADATVSVERDQMSPTFAELVLRINGKGDASSHGDLSTQILLGQLPLMMKPDSKDVFCFGMGSGITAGTVLGHPIEHLAVAENCEPVMRAARLFAQWNQGVLTNDRVRLYREDARTVLKLSPQKYDAIISEPSNPWMANVGSVFSYEFYKIAASRLKPGGIMTQWFHMYEIDDESVDLVLRTFASVFPSMEIWDVGGGDIILLGSDRPWESNPKVYARVFEFAKPRNDLFAIGLTSPEAVLARQLASQETAFAIPGAGPIQHDHFPILEYTAPRAMYVNVGRQAQRLQRFDERTWQSNVAPIEKDRVLAALDDADLKSIFCGAFGSMDPGLQYYVRMRVEENVAPDFGLLAMPCVFRGTNDIVPLDPPNAPPMFHALANAEVMLERDSPDRIQAAEQIKRMLDDLTNYNRQESGWSAGYYAYLAAEVSLRLKNPAQAKAILQRGLQLEPESEELNYLARIMERK